MLRTDQLPSGTVELTKHCHRLPSVRLQSAPGSGQPAVDPDKLVRLGRYEVHRDRKLERMLTMLLRLKDLRGTTVEG